MSDSVFACELDDSDLVRARAPEQPDEVKVGQEWMNLRTGSIYPVKALRGWCIDLGSEAFTIVLDAAKLRQDYVCIDAPREVTRLPSPGDPQP